tara:strand:+ start:283 stop:780 length:498 start_codon:yes stop_codon:yes gene_type:complete
MEWVDPPSLPSLTLPDAPVMPPTIFEVPQGEIPSYTPLVVPPNTLRQPEGVEPIELEDDPPTDKEEQSNPTATPKPAVPKIELPPEAQIVEIPFTDLEVPMPTTTIMTTAATTAFISVAATLTATSLFKYLVMVMKPILKQVWNKITKRKQDLSNSLSSSGQQDS